MTDTEATRLIAAAREAARHAHAPYSRFAVGAALLEESPLVGSGKGEGAELDVVRAAPEAICACPATELAHPAVNTEAQSPTAATSVRIFIWLLLLAADGRPTGPSRCYAAPATRCGPE